MKISLAVVSVLASFAVAIPGKPPKGCTPATYQCLTSAKGWQVCNTSGQWVFAGNYPPKTVYKFYPPSKSPYCVPPDFHFP
ncbi:hypothetical protein B0J13DRAFT_621609 [Dactylonectria estremocensis]|uniref:Uncharacterized protein n=1 Tax=Dactylonectria estremocensis TaxID=1079267 RepID=A0A9P9EWX4_9HYPO|nr:hypothetical protein B0J13DRAFT_621609 [Dactylonectria estremocensis]